MNYYERYLGDYGKKTSRLTLAQHGAYTLLLDAYYSEEEPLPSEYDELYRMCRAMTKEEKEAVRKVADTFFPVAADGLRHNERADAEISKAQAKINASKENGKRGGRPKKDNPPSNPKETQEKPTGFSNQNPAETHPGVHHAPTPGKPISESSVVPPEPSVDDSPPNATREGLLCRKLRAVGVQDAAPHLLRHPDWQALLARRTDEEIIGIANAKVTQNPGKRISLNYLAPALADDGRGIPQGGTPNGNDHRTATVAAFTGSAGPQQEPRDCGPAERAA